MLGVWLLHKGYELPNWEEFEEVEIKNTEKDNKKLEYSFPDWLYEYGKRELGEEKWHRYLDWMHHEAPVFLRVNLSKTTREKVLSKLNEKGIEAFEVSDSWAGICLSGRPSLNQEGYWKNGFYEIQDINSQKVIESIKELQASKIIDACAGAGGKTVQLADFFPKASILALDLAFSKLKELEKRIRRSGFKNVRTQKINNTFAPKEKADVLVLDVPCSGSGTFKRNVDAKWKLKPDFLEKIKNTQQDILNRYSDWLISGGELLYITCSVFPSENEEQIRYFLASNKQFHLVEEGNLSPENGDGFYFARLRKYDF